LALKFIVFIFAFHPLSIRRNLFWNIEIEGVGP
jgi:hypothetical protein